jgi:hypothetical protein
VTAIPTDRIKCPVRKGVTHAPTFLSGHCTTGYHGSCHGSVTNGCGCVIPCRCTQPGHPADRPHLYEETPVLPSPFSVPDPKAAEHPEALVTPPQTPPVAGAQPLAQTVSDWTGRTTPPDRPWIDGTGEAGTLEVMVRCFALAAGDLLLSDDGPADYDETAVLALLGILRASVGRAQDLDAILVAHLHEHGTWGRRMVDGIGEVRTYRREAKVDWDDYGTAYAVVDQHIEANGGEQPDPLEVVRWVLEAAAVGYYRKGALRALDLDPQDYYTSEKGTRAVDVPVPH